MTPLPLSAVAADDRRLQFGQAEEQPCRGLPRSTAVCWLATTKDRQCGGHRTAECQLGDNELTTAARQSYTMTWFSL